MSHFLKFLFIYSESDEEDFNTGKPKNARWFFYITSGIFVKDYHYFLL